MLKCTEYPSNMLWKESDLPLGVCCCILQMYRKSVLELWAINTFPEDTWRETKLACDLAQFCLNRSWLYLWFKMALLTHSHSQGVLLWLCGGDSWCHCRLLTPLVGAISWDCWNLPIAMDTGFDPNADWQFPPGKGWVWLLFMEMPSEEKHR